MMKFCRPIQNNICQSMIEYNKALLRVAPNLAVIADRSTPRNANGTPRPIQFLLPLLLICCHNATFLFFFINFLKILLPVQSFVFSKTPICKTSLNNSCEDYLTGVLTLRNEEVSYSLFCYR